MRPRPHPGVASSKEGGYVVQNPSKVVFALKGIQMKRVASARQSGQTVLWFVATLAACCALLMIVFNVGQVATEKAKTTNASDAVAMSAALVQARGMNLMSYTNRAIIADEMTIATIASLDSWIKYNTQLATTLSYIPYVNYIAQPIADAMMQISNVLQQIIGPVINGIQFVITGLQIQNDALQFQGAVIPEAVREAAQQVADQNKVDMNDASFFTIGSFVKNIKDNRNLFQKHQNDSNGDDRADAAVVMMRSRDQWNAKRGAGKAIDALNFGASFAIIAPQLEKTSGSARLRDNDHWEDQDSLDLFMDLCFPIVGCVGGFPFLPLGWGRANVNNDGGTGDNWASFWGNSWCDYSSVAPACALAPENADTFTGWKGVPEMWDVKGANRKNEMRIYVSVKSKAGNPPLTSQQMGIDNVDVPGAQGSPRVIDSLAPSQALINGGGPPELQAISAGRVFFRRPKQDPNDPTARGVFTSQGLFRSDGVQEFGSLYNPYWQARLHTPNCKITDPTSDDCIARAALNDVPLEGALDLVQ